ncbi:MAG: hypothetical protein KME28_04120 [Pelatocladus maniniholoensis HA4357-MV3]|uniref:Carbohydrate kinase FGGY N-terminal domain-containing protein n=1 Tax=Pelatocladus maniniholoensis HA4357-MV3 TaxID=1117104 RepID=A0A9E3H553_9NOST|nr:hypothetical protein [Pelatocladus maniniholoensis HA4357-MV3]
MNHKRLVIGIDCSTTACKAIAWNQQGKAVASGRASYPLLQPQVNWYEQDAAQWWHSTCSAIKQLLRQIDTKQINTFAKIKRALGSRVIVYQNHNSGTTESPCQIY